MNTFSELEPGYTAALQRQLAGQGTRVLSFHPFTSGMEPFFFATDYERRAADGRELYKRLFDCAARYGARIFTFHGDYKTTPYPFERYCENFAGLSALAREYGLLLCQENVVPVSYTHLATWKPPSKRPTKRARMCRAASATR